MTEPFGFNKALKAIQSGQAMSGKGGVLAPLLKQLTEAVKPARQLKPVEINGEINGTYTLLEER